jgi:hypothetical protein
LCFLFLVTNMVLFWLKRQPLWKPSKKYNQRKKYQKVIKRIPNIVFYLQTLRSRNMLKFFENLNTMNKKIRYTAARENILKRHKSVEPNLNLNLGLHSVRSVGASATVRCDVNERCIKRYGQWKSDVCKDGYIADTFARTNRSYRM